MTWQPNSCGNQHARHSWHEDYVPPGWFVPAELLGNHFPDEVDQVVDRSLEQHGRERHRHAEQSGEHERPDVLPRRGVAHGRTLLRRPHRNLRTEDSLSPRDGAARRCAIADSEPVVETAGAGRPRAAARSRRAATPIRERAPLGRRHSRARPRSRLRALRSGARRRPTPGTRPLPGRQQPPGRGIAGARGRRERPRRAAARSRPACDRRAAHLVAGTRVVEHERRPAVGRKVAHFPAAGGGREDHALAVSGVPHRGRVDEAGRVVCREDADQPCIEELADQLVLEHRLSAEHRARRRLVHGDGRYASRDPSCIVRYVND